MACSTFSYMQPLTRGDLSIFVSDGNGPVTPVRVVYTLFEVRPDNSLKQVGASGRAPVPVQGSAGEYYVTGRAGELGQPGRWLVRWEYQYTTSSAVQVLDQCFSVKDAVLARDPLDILVREQKYGWD